MARTNAATIATGATLAAALSPVGAPIPLGLNGSLAVWLDYTRHAASTTGAPIVAVEVSRDPQDTEPGSVGHWSRLPIVDQASYSAGRMDVEPFEARLQPSAAGTTTYHVPDLSVRHYNWCRILLADDDTTNRGTADVAVTVQP